MLCRYYPPAQRPTRSNQICFELLLDYTSRTRLSDGKWETSTDWEAQLGPELVLAAEVLPEDLNGQNAQCDVRET